MGLTLESNNKKGAKVHTSMSYRSFEIVRTTLHYALYGTNGKERIGWGGEEPWPDHPLTPFLHHPDNCGDMTPKECEKASVALYQTLGSQAFRDALQTLIEKQEGLKTVRAYQGLLNGLGDQLDESQKLNVQHLSTDFEDALRCGVLMTAYKIAYVLEFCARRNCKVLFL